MLTAALSAHYHHKMENEFTTLEKRLDQLIVQFSEVCQENLQLRGKTTRLLEENHGLKAKLNQISVRVEGVLSKLPE